MDLFTYLLAKNDKASIVHKGDLFSYLLGRNAKGELKTATGTNIYITDAIKTKINKLLMTKESTQDGTPSPENPVEVKTVKGSIDIKIVGKNLFDKDKTIKGYYNSSGEFASSVVWNYLEFKPIKNTDYYFSGLSSVVSSVEIVGFDENNNITIIKSIGNGVINSSNYIKIGYSIHNNDIETFLLEVGTQATSYEPYKESIFTISLGDNEIAGIGNYKDELIVDRNGHCWLNKKIGKVVLDGSETVTVSNTGTPNWYYVVVKSMENYIGGIGMSTHYPLVSISNSNTSQGFNIIGSPKSIRIRYGTEDTPTNFKNWLSNNNVEIYDVLATENLIDLNYTVDIRLFKGVNNISNSDDMNMTLEYY